MIQNSHHPEPATRVHRADVPATAERADPSSNATAPRCELRFRSLFDEGRGYALPCDGGGHIDLDALGDMARNNYFYARSVVGREFSMPVVQLCAVN